MEEKKPIETLEEAKKHVDPKKIGVPREQIAVISVFVTPVVGEDGQKMQHIEIEHKVREGVVYPELAKILHSFANQLAGMGAIPVGTPKGEA